MTAEIFNAISESDFRIKAFSDYCDDTQRAYQQLLQAESMALEVVPDDPDDDQTIDYNAEAVRILGSLGISPKNMLLFNKGYISSEEYISSLIKGFKETIIDEEGTLAEKTVILQNAAGEQSAVVNLDQLSLEVKENLYSITSLCAANAAATIDNAADRIAVFNDKMTTIFNNAYSTISSTATYLRSMISDANFSSKDYLDRVNAVTGISKLATDGSTSTPEEMDITKFTGANPACALNFNGVFSTIGTIFNVGLKVVGGILSVGASLIGRVFSKVGNFFHRTLVDPYDIEEINSKTSCYTVDGWRYNQKPYNTQTSSGAFCHLDDASYNFYLSNLSDEEINAYVGKWVKYETIFGELMFNIDKWEKLETDPVSYTFYPYIQFKPKALNPDAVYLSAKTVWGEDASNPSRRIINVANGAPTKEQLLQFIDILKNQPDLYLTTDADEKKLYLAFVGASFMSDYFADCALKEMLNSIPNSGETRTFPLFNMCNIDDWIATDLKRKVTNLDFVSAVSGWDPKTSTFISHPLFPCDNPSAWKISPFPTASYINQGIYYILAWMLNRADRAANPITYTFVPYRNNVDTWNDSKFRIKTDSENQQAFNTLLTVMIVIVVVAVIAISATIAIKAAARALYMKRTAALGVMDNAMWNGQPLTAKQKRKYIRLQRKLNGSSALSSGLQDSTNLFSSISDAVSTVSEDISGVSQIAALIKP